MDNNKLKDQLNSNLISSKKLRILNTCILMFGFICFFITPVITLVYLKENSIKSSETNNYSFLANHFTDRSNSKKNILSSICFNYEMKFYNSLNSKILTKIEGINNKEGIEYFKKFKIRLLFSIDEIFFIILFYWKIIWVLCFLTLLKIYFKNKSYIKNNLLGLTGNNRLFFSGINISLNNKELKNPEFFIPNLCNLNQTSISQAMSSSLGKEVNKIKGINKVNLKLIAIINYYKNVPCFAKQVFSKETTDDQFPLFEKTTYLVKNINNLLSGIKEDNTLLNSLKIIFDDENIKVLKSINPNFILTGVLALQAGKILSYKNESGEWTDTTSFPELSARAVLNSLFEFKESYNYQERAAIRQALIYSSRNTVFGPVKKPVNLPLNTKILRDLFEIIKSNNSQDVINTSQEIKLNIIITKFIKSFNNKISNLDVTEVNENIILVKIDLLTSYFKKSLSLDNELIDLIKKVLLFQSKNYNLNENANESYQIPEYLKLLSELNEKEIDFISRNYLLDKDEISLWSTLRIILKQKNLLAEKIGDLNLYKNIFYYKNEVYIPIKKHKLINQDYNVIKRIQF